MDRLIDLALDGIERLAEAQRRALGSTLADVAAAEPRGRRKPAPPRDERTLWGKP